MSEVKVEERHTKLATTWGAKQWYRPSVDEYHAYAQARADAEAETKEDARSRVQAFIDWENKT